MTRRRATRHIVLHCSATRGVQDVGAEEIRRWHLARGWRDIGYHYVIRRDGTVERGRPEAVVGSHVARHNADTLGVCLVGGLAEEAPWPPADNFTKPQWAALKRLVAGLVRRFPHATVLGHRDFPGVAKACPCFEARAWARLHGFPAAP